MPDLPELDLLLRLAERIDRDGHGRVDTLATVDRGLPVLGISLGTPAPARPLLVLVGGVHGLERIGTQVVLAVLRGWVERLAWDDLARTALQRARIALVPLVNPGGMARRWRANARGVDLMRNAPDLPGGWSTPLVGGQRLSPRLPWYRGAAGAPMEVEARALLDFVAREAAATELALVLDVHSGFGRVDRIWFPYAWTRRPLPHLAELFALRRLLDQTLPHHTYRMEPQSLTYTVQGDLWDHLYEQHRAGGRPGLLLPLTLEMGSWLWVKKNPRQLFSRLGSFNPIVPHRLSRTLRRHLLLVDFLHRAAASHPVWTGAAGPARDDLSRAAFQHWYGKR